MANLANSVCFKHSAALRLPQQHPADRRSSPIGFRTFRRSYVVSSSDFTNENREFVIVGGGNAAGYAARTFVEHGMADGRLAIVSKEAVAPYERPALTKGYLFPSDKKPARLPGFHTCVGSGGDRQTPDWYKEKGIEMFYEDPVTNVDIEKQTLTTNSGKLLKFGSLIIATGCTASRFPEKIGGNLPGVHYIRDVADADALVSSLEKTRKVVVVGGGYIGMEVAAATIGWKLDTTIIFPENHLLQRLFTASLAQRYEEFYQENGVKFVKGASIKNLEAGADGRVNYVKLEDGSPLERLATMKSDKVPLPAKVAPKHVPSAAETNSFAEKNETAHANSPEKSTKSVSMEVVEICVFFKPDMLKDIDVYAKFVDGVKWVVGLSSFAKHTTECKRTALLAMMQKMTILAAESMLLD